MCRYKNNLSESESRALSLLSRTQWRLFVCLLLVSVHLFKFGHWQRKALLVMLSLNFSHAYDKQTTAFETEAKRVVASGSNSYVHLLYYERAAYGLHTMCDDGQYFCNTAAAAWFHSTGQLCLLGCRWRLLVFFSSFLLGSSWSLGSCVKMSQ